MDYCMCVRSRLVAHPCREHGRFCGRLSVTECYSLSISMSAEELYRKRATTLRTFTLGRGAKNEVRPSYVEDASALSRNQESTVHSNCECVAVPFKGAS